MLLIVNGFSYSVTTHNVIHNRTCWQLIQDFAIFTILFYELCWLSTHYIFFTHYLENLYCYSQNPKIFCIKKCIHLTHKFEKKLHMDNEFYISIIKFFQVVFIQQKLMFTSSVCFHYINEFWNHINEATKTYSICFSFNTVYF